jgi:hypothetical protein
MHSDAAEDVVVGRFGRFEADCCQGFEQDRHPGDHRRRPFGVQSGHPATGLERMEPMGGATRYRPAVHTTWRTRLPAALLPR